MIEAVGPWLAAACAQSWTFGSGTAASPPAGIVTPLGPVFSLGMALGRDRPGTQATMQSASKSTTDAERVERSMRTSRVKQTPIGHGPDRSFGAATRGDLHLVRSSDLAISRLHVVIHAVRGDLPSTVTSPTSASARPRAAWSGGAPMTAGTQYRWLSRHAANSHLSARVVERDRTRSRARVHAVRVGPRDVQHTWPGSQAPVPHCRRPLTTTSQIPALHAASTRRSRVFGRSPPSPAARCSRSRSAVVNLISARPRRDL